MKALGLACLLVLVPIGALNAQAVRGRLVEAGTDVAVVGALVLLQDSAGKRVAQAVSGSEGRFSLRAPAPGAYLLRILRIGYLPVDSTVSLSEGETLTRTMALAGAPVALPEITVAGTATCGDRARKDTLSRRAVDPGRDGAGHHRPDGEVAGLSIPDGPRGPGPRPLRHAIGAAPGQ